MNLNDGSIRSVEQLAAFRRAVPGEVAALRQAAAAANRPEFLPLDGSYESLDRVEDFLRFVLDSGAGDPHVGTVQRRVTAYLGQTLIDNAGGRWDYGRARDDRPGQPAVSGLPVITRFRFAPSVPVAQFRRYHIPGWLREQAQSFDIPRLREQTATLLRERDREMAALRHAVQDLLGEDCALEFDVASLDPLERALNSIDLSDRGTWRFVSSRVALYIGELARRQTGVGEWHLCEDPRNAHFAHLRIGEWCPLKTVLPAYGQDAGALRRSLEDVIEWLRRV